MALIQLCIVSYGPDKEITFVLVFIATPDWNNLAKLELSKNYAYNLWNNDLLKLCVLFVTGPAKHIANSTCV